MTGPAALAVVALAVTVFAGCGMNEDANLERGRQLFVANCGRCHTLAQAGANATIGPNLDAAFATARQEGADSDTIAGVVSRQIEGPRPAEPDQTSIYMPPDLVTGQDRKDVAAYVGSVAGTGQQPPTVPGPEGAQVFANNSCGGCHTLAVASSSGTVGPVLDSVLPGQSAKEIEQSIIDPNARVEQGFPANTMPQNYETVIPPDELKSLVSYLSQCAGPKAPKTCTQS
jgi:mono/diheme cytochrome c family protein